MKNERMRGWLRNRKIENEKGYHDLDEGKDRRMNQENREEENMTLKWNGKGMTEMIWKRE